MQFDVVHGSVTIGIAENVSRHGLLMNCVEQLPVGQEIALSVELGTDHNLPLTGTVAWQHPSDAGILIGIQISEPSPSWEVLVNEIEGRLARRDPAGPMAPRATPRVPAHLTARYGFRNANEAQGLLLDLSPDGIGIAGPLAADEGDPVLVRFGVPAGDNADLIGNVVWLQSEGETSRMGVRLQSANEGYYRFLARLSSIPSEPPGVLRSPVMTSAPTSALAQRLEEMRRQDPFALLGLEPTDDDDAIEQAFFATVRRLHPQRLAPTLDAESLATAKEMFSLVSAAHRTLQDHAERQRLLSGLRATMTVPPPPPQEESTPQDDLLVPIVGSSHRPR